MSIEDKIIAKLDDITNPESKNFDPEVYEMIKNDAYFISKKDGFRLPPEQYWDLSKQYFHARILRRYNNNSEYDKTFAELRGTTYAYALNIIDKENLVELIDKHFKEFKELKQLPRIRKAH